MISWDIVQDQLFHTNKLKLGAAMLIYNDVTYYDNIIQISWTFSFAASTAKHDIWSLSELKLFS